jgi:hypothetical protein
VSLSVVQVWAIVRPEYDRLTGMFSSTVVATYATEQEAEIAARGMLKP